MVSFGATVELDDVKFESVYEGVGNDTNFVLIPTMKGMLASKTNKTIMQDCGIDVGSSTPIIISPCANTHHQQHD